MSEETSQTATDLERSGVVAVVRPDVYRSIKRQLDVEEIDHARVRSGFEEAGWTDSPRPDRLADDAAAVADDLRTEGRVIADHDEGCDRLVGVLDADESRERATSRKQGAFVEATGWTVDETGAGGRRKRFYLRPRYDLFERNGPEGSWPLSTTELFACYRSASVTAAVDRE